MFIDLKSLNTNRCHVDCTPVKKWAVFFTTILCSLVTADVSLKGNCIGNGYDRLDDVPGQFYPVCTVLLCNSLCLFKKYSASGFLVSGANEKKGDNFCLIKKQVFFLFYCLIIP